MLVIGDCNYVAWVVAHGMSHGLSYEGGPTTVIFGFMKQVVALLENFEATNVAFCWDSRDYKRKEIYPNYKKKDPLPEEDQKNLDLVYGQFNALREHVLPELGFSNVFMVRGYEADDLIANIVRSYDNGPAGTIVITRDQDLYQLLDYCSVYAISEGKTTTKELFMRHYGVTPNQWVTVKAISGCSSDKVRGVGGLGEKKAIDYILGKLNKGKVFMHAENSKDVIALNTQLVKLPFEGTPVPKLRNDNLTIGKFKDVCGYYGMNSFLEKKVLMRWEKIIDRIMGNGIRRP